MSVLLLGFAAGACSPPTVPNRPSWEQDVFPILQGSCNHCHGETVGRMAVPLTRLDICDPEPFDAAMISGKIGAAAGSALFELNILRPPQGTSRVQMPPPPAAPLSTYERDVLMRWARQAAMAGKVAGQLHPSCEKSGNRDPDMRFIGEPQWTADELQLTVDVWDPDGDQVMGKVSVGSATAIIPASGRRQVVVSGAQRGMPISVLLLDGYSSRTFSP